MSDRSIGIVCTSPGYGGLEMNTLKLANWLEGYGWQVAMLINADSPMSKEAGKFCKNVTTIQQIKPAQSKATPGVINKWLKGKNVSILFTPFNKDIKALSNYKRFFNRRVKLVYQQHMQVGVKKRDLIHTLRYNMLDLWISPLQYLKEETMLKTSVPSHKIAVITLGLDADQFLNSAITKEQARAELNLPQDVYLLGVLGRIDPKKGQDFLIRAVAHINTNFKKDYHLILMGNMTHNEGDEYFMLLEKLVAENNLNDQVHFRPYNQDVNLFYKAIDVFAMPSHGETYGMVTLEAMLSGKPVLGVNRDGTAELLQHGKFGWLHELDDLEDFTQKLFAIDHVPKTKTLLQAATEEVLNNYSFEYSMKEIDMVLNNLL